MFKPKPAVALAMAIKLELNSMPLVSGTKSTVPDIVKNVNVYLRLTENDYFKRHGSISAEEVTENLKLLSKIVGSPTPYTAMHDERYLYQMKIRLARDFHIREAAEIVDKACNLIDRIGPVVDTHMLGENVFEDTGAVSLVYHADDGMSI